MTEALRRHLPVIVVVSLLGIATCFLVLSNVCGNAANMDVQSFENAVFIIPCIVMLVCSFIIMLTTSRIGRQLFVTVVGICLALGVIEMVLTSTWLTDPAITSLLLANSDSQTAIVAPIQSIVLIVRNIAAYFVAPTVGCILGAWIGSRIHPMSSETPKKSKKRR